MEIRPTRDDVGDAKLLPVPLPTVYQPCPEIGEMATKTITRVVLRRLWATSEGTVPIGAALTTHDASYTSCLHRLAVARVPAKRL